MDHEPAFVAFYRGRTIATAQIVAVSADPFYVDRFRAMLPPEALDSTSPVERRPALHLVPNEPPDDAA